MVRDFFTPIKIVDMLTYGYLITSEEREDIQETKVGFRGASLKCESIWPYGISAKAPPSSKMIMLAMNAIKSSSAVIATYPQGRRTELKYWEIATGNFKTKAETFYDDDGNVNINSPQKDLNINAGNMNVELRENINVNCKNITINAEDVELNINSITVNAQFGITFNVGGNTFQVTPDGVKNNGKEVGEAHKHVAGDYKDSSGGGVTGISGAVE